MADRVRSVVGMYAAAAVVVVGLTVVQSQPVMSMPVGTTELVSVSNDGGQTQGPGADNFGSSISGDGRFVAFASSGIPFAARYR